MSCVNVRLANEADQRQRRLVLLGATDEGQMELVTLHDFLAEHWKHLRTTNLIESAAATIRLRHRRTKGCGTRQASLAMMLKLASAANKIF